jgi:RNA polymerase sigma factor (sigma-70 family)
VSADLDVHLPAIRRGEGQAFAAWLVGAEPSLRRGLSGFARRVDVEAVLQEALLRTWQVAPRFEPDGGGNALVRLAQRIATNLAISEERRRSRATPVDPELLEGGLDEALRWDPRLPDPLLREAIARCRDKLPPRPKEALAARLEGGGGVPDATLAERLGMAKNTFLQNFTRARKLLVECLRLDGIDLAAELT